MGREVAQTMYTHVSKCKNDKIKEAKKPEIHSYPKMPMLWKRNNIVLEFAPNYFRKEVERNLVFKKFGQSGLLLKKGDGRKWFSVFSPLMYVGKFP
jgi:hypothetical protein